MANKHFIGGTTNTVVHTEADGTFHVEERLDVEPIMDYTHAARNHRFSADALDGMYRHEGEIPFTIFQAECQRRGIPVDPFSTEGAKVCDEILRDPQFACFRAAPTQRDPRIRIKGLR
jgi:hypothetical protein